VSSLDIYISDKTSFQSNGGMVVEKNSNIAI